jgi:hypothetical protein
LKFLNFVERRPIRGARVSLSVRTIRGKQNVSNAAARLGLGTNGKLMQPNFKFFSIRKLDAHALAYVPLIETSRVHRHRQTKLLDGGNVVERADVDKMAGDGSGRGHYGAD